MPVPQCAKLQDFVPATFFIQSAERQLLVMAEAANSWVPNPAIDA